MASQGNAEGHGTQWPRASLTLLAFGVALETMTHNAPHPGRGA